MAIEYFGMSEAGIVREDNQDSIHLPDQGAPISSGVLFGLADGMGGYSYGGLASSIALTTLFAHYSKENHSGQSMRALQRGIQAANLAVINQAHQLAVSHMGTTLTALSISTSPSAGLPPSINIAHIGDSRAYIIRNGQALCLTNDHTVVGDLLRMRVIQPEQVRTHARRSILTRAIGMNLFIQPEFSTVRIYPDDKIILCSDGVWSVIQDHELARIACLDNNMETICRKILDTAIQYNSDDNISVIAIHILSFDPENKNGSVSQNWFKNLFSRDHHSTHTS